MPKICYVPKEFRHASLAIIRLANKIIEEYMEEGFTLTLRQLYYQFVARDYLPNLQTEYKRLGSIINDARYAGLIDWEALEDRTRNLEDLDNWTGPEHLVERAARWFHRDHWEGQEERVEVWVEKDALVGVIEPVCQKLDVPYFSCRGYVSSSEMWGAANRMMDHVDNDQRAVILHLGDHDPSGLNMTDVIRNTLDTFGAVVNVERIALTMEQIEELKPPPNPAKKTDSRYRQYVQRTGLRECWELDALDPRYMERLITDKVHNHVDWDLWNDIDQEEDREREQLGDVARCWGRVLDALELSGA